MGRTGFIATNFLPLAGYTQAITYIGGGGVEIYLDLVVILNFLVDFLLILGTNRLSGFAPGAKRGALAAGLGAAYAAGCVMPGFAFLGGLFWRLLSLTLMSVIAFGWSNGGLRRGVLFVFLSMALGGIALGMGSGGFWAIVLGALGVAILCVVGFCGRPGEQRYAAVTIVHGNCRLQLTALLDTGNTLRDPVSGMRVLVVDASVAGKILGLSTTQLLRPVETLASLPGKGLRLIPYHAVGQQTGMMLGMKVECLQINGKKEEWIVGFAPQNIGQGKPYQALAGGCVG